MLEAREDAPAMAPPPRRAMGAPSDIDEYLIEKLVRRFWQRAQADPVLGPIFAEKVSDWHAHIAKLCEFWSSVVLGAERYRGQPIEAHLGLALGGEHFDRWLVLFERAANETCPPAAARTIVERALRIGRALEVAVCEST